MKRRFPGLHQTVESDSVPDGVYLVRVEQVQYRWNAHKPFYTVRFQVLEPKLFVGCSIQARIYSTPKTLWKIRWFVRDFGYFNLAAFAPAAKWKSFPFSTSGQDSEVAS